MSSPRIHCVPDREGQPSLGRPKKLREGGRVRQMGTKSHRYLDTCGFLFSSTSPPFVPILDSPTFTKMGFPQAGLWAMARSLFRARLLSELRLNLLAYPVH